MNKINAIYVSLLALVISVACAAMCMMKCDKAAMAPEGQAGAPVASTVDVESVSAVLNSNPEIIAQAMQRYQAKMEEERQQAASKKVQENLKEITNYAGAGVIGNPDGKITLVEFFDYSCGYCHRLYPALKNIVAKNPDVRLVLRELTFLGPVSETAAKAALAAKSQGKYQELWTAMMENDGQLTEERIYELAGNIGINVEQMKADMASANVAKVLKDTSDLAGKIEIHGVPTMVLDGKILQTLDEAEIQSKIDAIRSK